MMISFNTEGGTFQYRVAAIILRGDEVLLHTWADEDFWCLPGGRVEMHEPGDVAMLRELAEEMAEEARIERLVWVVENLYEHRGVRYHEASLYFLVSLPEDSPAYRAKEPWTGTEVDGTELLFQWFRLDELELVNLLPSFLRTALSRLPLGIEYLVHRDGEN